nr:hypothetical protein [Tanacetum cinerariifolium]
MSKQCTKPKRKQDDSWFKDKVLLVQAQANGQILHEEELAFLADPRIAEVTHMVNLSHYGSDVLAEVAVQNSNSSAQQDALILSVIEQLKNQNSMNSSDHSHSCKPTKIKVPKELPKVRMEKDLVIIALKDELRKLKGKDLANNTATKHTIAPEMLKVDVEPIAPKLLNNRTVHSDYLRHTQEQAAIFRERPTGRTFTIVENACPLTRITTTTKVPLRKPTALETDTPKPVATLVYLRKPRKSKTSVHVSKPKIIKSISANNTEPSKTWGSIVFNVPSSSLDECGLIQIVLWFCYISCYDDGVVYKKKQQMEEGLNTAKEKNSAAIIHVYAAKFSEVKGRLVEDLVNYHLKELRCSAQCHTKKSMWINSRGKDCAQNVKNQSKTEQYQHKIRSQQQKPDQRAFFSANQAMKPKSQNNQSSGSILAIYQKLNQEIKEIKTARAEIVNFSKSCQRG